MFDLEIKIADRDIKEVRQVGTKESYHGYGNAISIMEEYVMIHKGEQYLVITRDGDYGEETSIHRIEDLFYILLDYLQFHDVDTRVFSKHITELEEYESAVKKIIKELDTLYDIKTSIDRILDNCSAILAEDESKQGDVDDKR